MGRQYFRETLYEPPIANQTAVTGGTSIVRLWDAPNLTTFGANVIRPGQAFKVTAWGVMTTAVTGGQTVVLTPVFGNTTGGTSLGASIAAPLEAKVFTNTPWLAQMFVHFRSVGSSGTATCIATMEALPFIGVAAGTSEGSQVTFGTASTTATTVDTTAATSGLLLAVTPSLATQSYTCMGVLLEGLS